MATTPRERLEKELARIGDLDNQDTRAALLDLATALDESKAKHTFLDGDGNERTHPPRTVERYVQGLRIVAESGIDLTAISASEFNAIIDAIHDDEGKAKTTLTGYQIGARKFYRFHDYGVEPDDIHVYNASSEPRHDEQDMFTEAEVDRLRDACGDTRMPVRNRALLELLVYTGQRIRALVTLRVGDVDVREGYLYLNDEVDGLKGALRRGRRRPLFGARKYVRDLINYHRADADADDWLFVGDPTHWKTDPDDHWSATSADHVLRRIRRYADVDKPVNAHNFRHYFTTEMKANPNVDNDMIRALLGLTETSDIFKTTYSHLEDGELMMQAEAALGYGDGEEDDEPARESPCPTCGEPLKPDWSRCPACDEWVGVGDDLADRVRSIANSAQLEAIRNVDADKLDAFLAMVEAAEDPEAWADRVFGGG